MDIMTEAKEAKKGSELIAQKPIDGTPFTVITHDGEEKKVHFVVMGKHRVSPIYDELEEAINDALTINWEKLIAVMGIMVEMQESLKNE